LIFAEHKQLTETVPLLNRQITNLELINKSWERTDSIHKVRTVQLEKTITDAEKSIIDLQKSLKRKQNTIKYGTAGSVLIILCLLLM
jgi:exonuclease VII small subunit